jgi:hypothetical protein
MKRCCILHEHHCFVWTIAVILMIDYGQLKLKIQDISCESWGFFYFSFNILLYIEDFNRIQFFFLSGLIILMFNSLAFTSLFLCFYFVLPNEY